MRGPGCLQARVGRARALSVDGSRRQEAKARESKASRASQDVHPDLLLSSHEALMQVRLNTVSRACYAAHVLTAGRTGLHT